MTEQINWRERLEAYHEAAKGAPPEEQVSLALRTLVDEYAMIYDVLLRTYEGVALIVQTEQATIKYIEESAKANQDLANSIASLLEREGQK